MEKNDFESLKRKADSGDVKAMYDLALNFYLDEDEAAAFKCFNQAAEAGYAPAMNMVGRCYFEGWGVAKDKSEAFKWIKKGAELGEVNAMSNLGREYCDEISNAQGVLDDSEYFKKAEEAFKWLKKADEAGTTDDVVLYMLGKFYEGYYEIDVTNDSIEEDRKKSILYYRKACALGNPDAAEALDTLEYEKDLGNTNKIAEDEATIKNDISDYEKIARLILKYFDYKSLIKIQKGEKFSYLDDYIRIRDLKLIEGDKIIISAKGDDAQEAVAAVKELIVSNFGEE